VREDSAGRGQWNGGPGTIFRLTALEPMAASLLGDRSRHAPFGVAGGGAGALLEVQITTGSGIVGGPGISSVRGVALSPGDVVELRSPGGGGYGSPTNRDPDAAAADLADGLVSSPVI
jgi:N-methylhydantoinase B/oxoprolinase/acetone carboxylase alpha subunit